jgi:hypothetical protein
MLERLLSLLRSGGLHTPAGLARELGVSAGLVEHMLADLARMGYLRPVAGAACAASDGGETGGCAGCSLAAACAAGRPGGRVWALTEKRPDAPAISASASKGDTGSAPHPP